MPRPSNISRPEDLGHDALDPLVGHDGPNLATALFALSTWGTSTVVREQLMKLSRFPLPDDLPAFLLINQLIYRGAARPTDLADAIDTGKSNISKCVTRLQTHGLVHRVADPSDNRAIVVALTGEGREVAQRIVDASSATVMGRGEGWSNDDSTQFEALLIKLVRSLDAAPGHPLAVAAGVELDSNPQVLA